MKAVVQRVTNATVTVNGVLKGGINRGLLVYLGVDRDDDVCDADWLVEKIAYLRIFDDSEGKMNVSLMDIVNQHCIKVNENDVNQQKEVVNNMSVNHINCEVNKARLIPHTELREGIESADEDENSESSPRSPCLRENPGILAISQFTLLGDARKGRRPTWDRAAPPEKARELYVHFIKKMGEKASCESGEFQAHMMVNYTNDGPVTILLDSREKWPHTSSKRMPSPAGMN